MSMTFESSSYASRYQEKSRNPKNLSKCSLSRYPIRFSSNPKKTGITHSDFLKLMSFLMTKTWNQLSWQKLWYLRTKTRIRNASWLSVPNISWELLRYTLAQSFHEKVGKFRFHRETFQGKRSPRGSLMRRYIREISDELPLVDSEDHRTTASHIWSRFA